MRTTPRREVKRRHSVDHPAGRRSSTWSLRRCRKLESSYDGKERLLLRFNIEIAIIRSMLCSRWKCYFLWGTALGVALFRLPPKTHSLVLCCRNLKLLTSSDTFWYECDPKPKAEELYIYIRAYSTQSWIWLTIKLPSNDLQESLSYFLKCHCTIHELIRGSSSFVCDKGSSAEWRWKVKRGQGNLSYTSIHQW